MGRRNNPDAFFWRSVRLYKLNLIRQALVRSDGVIAAAARQLEISRQALDKEIKTMKSFGHDLSDVLNPTEAESTLPGSTNPQQTQLEPRDDADE